MSELSAAEAMLARDRASASLGMTAISCVPGLAVVEMTVRDDMLNGHGVAHGAFVFAVADTAFALACNEDERVTLAAGADIAFLRPARAGMRLHANARRVALSGRSGIYDVEVVDADTGSGIAVFRGRSRTLAG